MCKLTFVSLAAIAALTAALPSAPGAEAVEHAGPGPGALSIKPRDVRPGAFPSQVRAALAAVAQDAAWQPKVNPEKSRGSSQVVYPKVAPATVVVRCADGHGTGFIVDPAGWIVTNQHVIARAPLDARTGAPRAIVHVGQLENGWMKMDDEALPALVYKSDPNRDLALLKLVQLPSARDRLEAIPLASSVPPPGSDCVAIGHPAAGMLWTVRSGELAGSGLWPKQMIDVIMTSLAAPPDERQTLRKILGSLPERKILLSTCGLNPGDSGGPLVDSQGRLIGVSFAIPDNERSPRVNLDKFSYHVHLEEVKAFLADRPEVPAVHVPDPWPPGRFHALVDLDEDGREDALVFLLEEKGEPTGMLVDLDGDSALKTVVVQFFSPEAPAKWDFEFAVQRHPVQAAFYDTDHDTVVDLCLLDSDGDLQADGLLRLKDAQWKAEPPRGQRLFDAAHFEDKTLARRFHELRLDRK